MKNIKFRVWEKSEKRFIDLNGFDTAFGKMPNMGEITCIYEQGRLKSPLMEDCIISQFTGLLDKNGKEIYEGDIMERENSQKVHEIVFEDGSFKEKGSNILFSNSWNIVGNKFKNPELINKS